LADFAVRTAQPIIGAETVVLLRWDPTLSEFRAAAGRGVPPQAMKTLRARLGEGVLGKAAQAGKAAVVQETSSDSATALDGFLTAPYLVLPLWTQSRVQALFAFCKPSAGRFGAEETRLATLVAKHLEVAIENLDLYESRQHVYGELISALAHAGGARDPGGQAHAQNSRNLVQAMAREMKLPRMLSEQIEYAALLHDIGKVGVPDAILRKTGPLTGDEYAAVKRHPQIGHDILNHLDFFKGIAPIILYHHEWVNGQGYPEGLAGEEIPLGARMVAIVDAWDSMITEQPYRPALSKNAAIAELRQQAGTQFDPKLVDVFLHVVLTAPANV
jgi:response regulator RpfG family c-di-GMP phosphodiesterase